MRLSFKTLSFFLSCLLVMLFFVFSSFSEKTDYQYKSNRFWAYADELQASMVHLDTTANAYKLNKTEIENVKAAVKLARLSYKNIEFYFAFYHQEYVNEHINGAPLLHIKKSGMLPDVIPPEGLQVLDELVHEDEEDLNANLIATNSRKLFNAYQLLYKGLKTKTIEPENEIAAMRLGLVRIFTLGVTGFDTPGSLNVIEEARVSMEAMNAFLKDFYQYNPSKELKDVINLFSKSIHYLKQPTSFEDFDRLVFLKAYINPLYQKLGELEQKEVPDFLSYVSAWNPKSESIFSEDFLNPYFFTELKKEEDSKALNSLGEKLFYDSALSENQKISCASCHNPKLAFTDGQPKSLSNIEGNTVLRNSPTLLNAVYAERFFYDLRAFSLEQQAEHVIFNPEEFNTAYDAILKKLTNNGAYASSFEKVFGKDQINRENFSKALSSYVLSLTSFDSEFDEFINNENATLSKDIKNGFNLFMGKANCATCHFPPTFSGLVPPFYSDSESEILGVLKNPKEKEILLDTDEGRWQNSISNEKAWIYEKSFKTTTVRNTGLTAPYFHNGAYTTLEEVIDFYNDGGGEGKGLKVINQTLSPDPLNLSDKEKQDLIAFIKSLNGKEAVKLNQ
jgi:cytochrome c peroxidase